jgi:hypothetical protein
MNEILGYTIKAIDGDIGHCRDFLVEDEYWTMRYMMLDTGNWLPGQKVLISPIALTPPDWESRHFPVLKTKEQIEKAPDLDEHAPVSRQYEAKWSAHFGYPYYWGGEALWGAYDYPSHLLDEDHNENQDVENTKGDPHLRSVSEIVGYYIKAVDGEIGHVHDFIVDDETWAIRYLVIDTKNWLPGKKVLIAPDWINSVSWEDKEMRLDLTVNVIKDCPEYDASAPVNMEYEAHIYDFYGRPKYWEQK